MTHLPREGLSVHAYVKRPRRVLLLLFCAALGVLGETSAAPTLRGAAASEPRRPNILVIVIDDMRPDGLTVMPKTKSWLAGGGTLYTRGFATTPSCCPARSSIMTGRYVHNHGVRCQNCSEELDHSTTLQHVLRRAGYFTAMSGKYLNDNSLGIGYTPPGFDRYTVAKQGYVDPLLNRDGVVRQVPGYTTTLLGNATVNSLRAFQRADDARPWYMYFALIAPHSPATPEARYADAAVPRWVRPPFEADRSDKPAYVRARTANMRAMETLRAKMMRSLMSVDDQVDRLLRLLRDQGELDNTLIFFLGDNGFMFGEHGLSTKFAPYTPSIQVPFLVRWDGHIAAGVPDRERFVTNVDIAPTIFQAAGLPPSSLHDGTSLLQRDSRARLFTEYFSDQANDGRLAPFPTWASLRGPGWQYIENYAADGSLQFPEYYDLRADPHQLVNLLVDGDSTNDPPTAWLSMQLADERQCSGAACR